MSTLNAPSTMGTNGQAEHDVTYADPGGFFQSFMLCATAELSRANLVKVEGGQLYY